MLQTVVVDDERHCIDRITQLIQRYPDTFNLVSSCSSISQAKIDIAKYQPDVVFLDVHLGEGTGFDLLKSLPKINFEIIFTTAFDSYAVEAFKFSALDYLLKPVDPDLFDQAVIKLDQKRSQGDLERKIQNLFYNMEERSARSKKIAIPTLGGLDFVLVSNIIRCQADTAYTDIYLTANKKLKVTKTLKFMESHLNHHNFFRTHQSHLINLDFAEKYLKGKGGFVLMSDGSQIEVAVRRKEEFLRRFTDLD